MTTQRRRIGYQTEERALDGTILSAYVACSEHAPPPIRCPTHGAPCDDCSVTGEPPCLCGMDEGGYEAAWMGTPVPP